MARNNSGRLSKEGCLVLASIDEDFQLGREQQNGVAETQESIFGITAAQTLRYEYCLHMI